MATEPSVQIVSDGTPTGTTVKVDGQPLGCVTAVRWAIDGPDRLAQATVELDWVHVEYDATGRVVTDGPSGRDVFLLAAWVRRLRWPRHRG